jgi:hypothetical protein
MRPARAIRAALTAALAGALVVQAAAGLAATGTATLRVNATVSGRAKLSLSPLTINFPDRDPDLVNRIAATENSVTVSSRMRTGRFSMSLLVCQASGDLQSGASTIPISNVTWQASGTGYSNGTMSASAPQVAGSWIGSRSRTGAFDYYLNNSWAYNAGNYTQTVVYTLIVP